MALDLVSSIISPYLWHLFSTLWVMLVLPGAPELFFSPCNWACQAGVAVTANPGAYAKLEWTTSTEARSEDEICIEVDSSSMDRPCVSLLYTIDGGTPGIVEVPHGQETACIVLPVPVARVKHSLMLALQNSVQQLDRWGEGAEGPPRCSLRLRAIKLPQGSTLANPTLRPYRVAAFGDSITEGVSAAYPGRHRGDLGQNAALPGWVSTVAECLDAEFGCIGFGRQGWRVQGNGGVPNFHTVGVEAESSWRWLWRGKSRELDQVHLDVIIILHGTNDGLTGGDTEAVAHSVTSFLACLREAVGHGPSIVLCVPFGGFGGSKAPKGALADGYSRYQRIDAPADGFDADERCHLLDLGAGMANGLSEFRILNGRYAPTDDSCDGIHPTVQCQQQLGEIMGAEIRRLLASTSH